MIRSIIFATVLLTSFLPSTIAESKSKMSDEWPMDDWLTIDGNVIKVTDGDTIRFNDERIRLLYIDTPEITRPRCPAELMLGMRAKWALINFMRKADAILISRDGEDKYGRTLASVTITVDHQDTDISGHMLTEGYALPYIPGKEAKAERLHTWCKDLK